MDPYILAMTGNALLTAFVAGLIFDPFGIFDSDDGDGVDPDQTVTLTSEADFFSGGSGADTVFGVEGDDEVLGNAGDDLLYGGDDNDTLDGGIGDDLLYGGDSNDILDGGAGDDTLEGNLDADILNGGDGDDTLLGGAGTDTLNGGAGNDVIATDRLDSEAAFNRGSIEIVDGGDGDDRLVFSTEDEVTGGEGTDQFELVVVGNEDPAVIEDFDTQTESLTVYYDPADFDDRAPELTLSVDADADLTQVLLDGSEVLTLNGVQDLDATTVTLLTEDELA